MGAFVTRQPNGLLCRFSSVVDCPTHYNMTDEEYIEMCAEKAREEARDVLENHLKPFEWLRNYFRPNNMTQEEFENVLKEMEVSKELIRIVEEKGNMERLTIKAPSGLIHLKDNQEVTINAAIKKLAEYEDLEEQGKLLIMAFDICVVSECAHCNHVQRRIEETWIRPELLNHDGFYKTREEAEAALKELKS